MKNKSVLITGAAKRIGREIALSMADDGWDIAIHYNSSKKEAEELLQEIVDKGVRACKIQADLANETQVLQIISQANEELGEISCLINNASSFKNDDITDMSRDIWDAHMQINLRAPVILSQEFAKQLNGKGNIINMLDYCVLSPSDKFLSYTASKSALWTLTQTLAKQLAPNIRVNAIGPGHCLPNCKETDESFQEAIQSTPLKEAISVKDICQTVEFFLKTPSITGQIIALDGGKHLVNATFY